MVLVIKVVTNIFFSETYNDFIFLSLDSRCEASSKQEVGSKLGQLSSSKLLSDLKNTLFLLITCFLPCLLIQYDLSLESWADKIQPIISHKFDWGSWIKTKVPGSNFGNAALIFVFSQLVSLESCLFEAFSVTFSLFWIRVGRVGSLKCLEKNKVESATPSFWGQFQNFAIAAWNSELELVFWAILFAFLTWDPAGLLEGWSGELVMWTILWSLMYCSKMADL